MITIRECSIYKSVHASFFVVFVFVFVFVFQLYFICFLEIFMLKFVLYVVYSWFDMLSIIEAQLDKNKQIKWNKGNKQEINMASLLKTKSIHGRINAKGNIDLSCAQKRR